MGNEILCENSENKSIDDGINYELLGKDRSLCTAAELDKIRRERNRMHAKRTRDRKRIFLEEMEVTIRQLEGENKKLREHVEKLHGSKSVVVDESSNITNCSDSV